MNAKLLAEETRALIAKTRKIIQISTAQRERSQQLSGFTDPKLAKRIWLSIFGPARKP